MKNNKMMKTYEREFFSLWWEDVKSWFGWGGWKKTMTSLFVSLTIIYAFLYLNQVEVALENIAQFIFSFLAVGIWFLFVSIISYVSANKNLFEKQQSIEEEQKKTIEKLEEKLSLRDVTIEVKKYIHPGHKKVGITINNKEQSDIDIYINLIVPIRQFSRNPNVSGWSNKDVNITYGKKNTLFDLGPNPAIKADHEETFVLAEIQNNETVFLLTNKPMVANLRASANIEQPTYNIYETKWELEFEIRGKVHSNIFRKQTYRTEIFSTRTIPIQLWDDQRYNSASIDIGEVIRIDQEKTS